jgi:hypothetical protein
VEFTAGKPVSAGDRRKEIKLDNTGKYSYDDTMGKGIRQTEIRN